MFSLYNKKWETRRKHHKSENIDYEATCTYFIYIDDPKTKVQINIRRETCIHYLPCSSTDGVIDMLP